ncbi:MAG: ABC transporter substrate-binding protein, partial [Acutalibacteraceae bacterium]
SANGISCKIEYLTEDRELAAKVVSGDVKLALLPQPFVTQVTVKNTDVRIAANLTEEWDAVAKNKGDESVLTMGCFIVRKEFAEEHPEAVEEFISAFSSSVDYVKSNIEEASQKVVDAGIMDSAAVIAKAIPNCNMVCVSGNEMKTQLSGFLQVLFDVNPSAVGGAMPDDSFYYVG